MKIRPADQEKLSLSVVGSGLEAAWIAAARGHKVVLFEQSPGGQFGWEPSHLLNRI